MNDRLVDAGGDGDGSYRTSWQHPHQPAAINYGTAGRISEHPTGQPLQRVVNDFDSGGGVRAVVPYGDASHDTSSGECVARLGRLHDLEPLLVIQTLG